MPTPSTPKLFPNVLGYAADVTDIPDATPTGQGVPSFRDLFPFITQVDPDAGGVMVERVWMNALFNLLGQHVFFQQSGCVYPWEDSLDYLVGCHVMGSDGIEYLALQASGPDVPDVGAKDPAQESNRAYWVSLASFVSGGLVPNSRRIIAGTGLSGGGSLESNITISLSTTTASVLSLAEVFRKTWIGIPRPWRSTTLPAGYVWADGSLVLFEDYPELEEVYNANGFAGMLLDWSSDEETIAANLGKWRPNSATPTGLFTPKLGGQFFRAWTGVREAGAHHDAGLPSLSGSVGAVTLVGDSHAATGVFSTSVLAPPPNGTNIDWLQGGTGYLASLVFDASKKEPIYGASDTVMPVSVDLPVMIYLGIPA